MTDQPHAFDHDLNWLLHRVSWAIGGLLDTATRRAGLSIRDYVVLRTVLDRPGLSQLALGSALGLDKTAITAVFDRLEKQELITRSPLPGDRRVRAAAVTEQGATVAHQAETLVDDAYAAALVDLSAKEIDSLLGVLQRLAASESVGSAPPTGSCM